MNQRAAANERCRGEGKARETSYGEVQLPGSVTSKQIIVRDQVFRVNNTLPTFELLPKLGSMNQS